MSESVTKKFEIAITCSILLVVPGLLHGCFRCNWRVFQGCYRGVLMVFHGCFKGVRGHSQWCQGASGISWVLDQSYKNVTKVLKGCFNCVLMK